MNGSKGLVTRCDQLLNARVVVDNRHSNAVRQLALPKLTDDRGILFKFLVDPGIERLKHRLVGEDGFDIIIGILLSKSFQLAHVFCRTIHTFFKRERDVS